MTCQDCGAPGGDVTIRRGGAIIWQRVLCVECFNRRRANTQARTGLQIAKAGEA